MIYFFRTKIKGAILCLLSAVYFFFLSCNNRDLPLQNEIELNFLKEYTQSSATNYTLHGDGFYYSIQDSGSGAPLKNDDFFVLTYTMSDLQTGQVYADVDLYTANVNQALYGYYGNEDAANLQQMVKKVLNLLNKGGRAEILIPSALAFGKNGNSTVPSNAIIKYTLSLINFESQEELEKTIIEDYISRNELSDLVYYPDEGYYYHVIDVGTGTTTINVFAEIETGYKLTGMNDAVIEEVNKETPVSFVVADLIVGVQRALPKIRAGGKIECIFPSRLAYNDRRPLHYVFEVVKVEY